MNKYYYINMERSVARREHFLDQCQREKVLNPERFPALDGNIHRNVV